MGELIVHRCPIECPYHKNCFVCKTVGEIKEDVVILHKCIVTKEDIPVHLGSGFSNKCVAE